MGRYLLPRLARQGGALGHAEAVLLIGNDEGQVLKPHAVGDEGVGTHHEVDLPPRQLCADLFLLRGGERAGQQPHPHPGSVQQGGQRAVMLFGQHLGGGHHSRLGTALHHKPGGVGRHRRLARTHVALYQPVHRPAAISSMTRRWAPVGEKGSSFKKPSA